MDRIIRESTQKCFDEGFYGKDVSDSERFCAIAGWIVAKLGNPGHTHPENPSSKNGRKEMVRQYGPFAVGGGAAYGLLDLLSRFVQ